MGKLSQEDHDRIGRSKARERRKRLSQARLSPDAIKAIRSAANQQIADHASPMVLRGRPKASPREGGSSLSHGTRVDDIWHPEDHEPGEAVSVEDPRQGQTVCSECGEQVALVEHDGVWSTRNSDGLPHRLTCRNETEGNHK